MAKSTTKPTLVVKCAHVGFKQAFGNLTLLQNGVLMGQTQNGSPYYKFRVAWRVYDKQGQDQVMNQNADITVWGKSYEWLAANLGQYDTVLVTGEPKFSARLGNDQKAYPQLDIENGNIEFVSRYQQQAPASQPAPAAAATAPQAAAPQQQQYPQQQAPAPMQAAPQAVPQAAAPQGAPAPAQAAPSPQAAAPAQQNPDDLPF